MSIKTRGARIAGAALMALAIVPWMGGGQASAGAPSSECPAGTVAIAKFNVSQSGQFKAEFGGDIVTVSGTTTSGSFTSTQPIAAVVIKGGTDSKVTIFDPAVLSGTFSNSGLSNGGGNTPAISNVVFCGPAVTETTPAETTTTAVTTTPATTPVTTTPAETTTTAVTTTPATTPVTTTPAETTTTAVTTTPATTPVTTTPAETTTTAVTTTPATTPATTPVTTTPAETTTTAVTTTPATTPATTTPATTSPETTVPGTTAPVTSTPATTTPGGGTSVLPTQVGTTPVGPGGPGGGGDDAGEGAVAENADETVVLGTKAGVGGLAATGVESLTTALLVSLGMLLGGAALLLLPGRKLAVARPKRRH